MANYRPEIKSVLDAMLLEVPLLRPGKMFGYPAYYAGRKLCICLYEEGVGLKVPERTALRLLKEDSNVIPFQPLGRKRMKEWIQINASPPGDYRRYQDIFEESIQYVLKLQEKDTA